MIIEAPDKTTVYTLTQLKDLILPLVEKYSLSSPALFGSYSRGEATADSDIDLLVDRNGQRYLILGSFMEELFQATGKRVDVYDYSELLEGQFKESVMKDLVTL